MHQFTMRRFAVLYVFLFFCNSALKVKSSKNHIKYEGHKLYHVHLNTLTYAKFDEFHKRNSQFVAILYRRSGRLTLLIHPKIQKEFENLSRALKMHVRILNANVAETILNETNRNKREHSGCSSPSFDMGQYLRHEEINKYLLRLNSEYPELVHLQSIGKSYEGRDLISILIASNAGNTFESAKPLIFIDAGIHAREWIAPATAVYIIQQLIEHSWAYRKELTLFDWLILPVVNPDGYEYTFEFDRFWRKNRRPVNSNNSSCCIGVDANRNFDFHWSYAGSSNDSWEAAYHGPHAFSEPETMHLRDLLLKIKGRCLMYLSLHSFGAELLYPWGYQEKLPSSWPYLHMVARAGALSIRNYSGTVYRIGSIENLMYAIAGTSCDFAYGVAHIPVSICMELPGGGSDGFDPPASDILSIAAEAWIGIRAMALEAKEYPERNIGRLSRGIGRLHFVILLLLSISSF